MEPQLQPPAKITPNLTGAPETLLAILIARAIDTNSAHPILGDIYAARIVDSLNYDFSKLGVHPYKAAVLALRARYLDRWVAAFLSEAQAQNEPVTVLHLAAGLDTRALRLQHGSPTAANDAALVHWVDVDLPPVVDVRRRLAIPEPAAAAMRYELRAADVAEENWLAKLELPRGRRTFVVFEGLTMYLDPARGRALIETLADYFVAERGNQMAFDCIHQRVVTLQKLEPIVRNTNSAFLWAINDSKEIETCHRALQLREEVSAADNPGNAELPALLRWALWFLSWIPGAKKQGRYVRFEW